MPSESYDEEHESMRIQQLEDDLKTLKKEHEEILAGENGEYRRELEDLEKKKQQRVHMADEIRTFQLENSEKCFEAEVKQAWDEFEADKRYYREKIFFSFSNRRKKLYSFLPRALRKQMNRRGKTATPEDIYCAGLLGGVQKEGLLRVSLTWDELQHDIEAMLLGLETVMPPKITSIPQRKPSSQYGNARDQGKDRGGRPVVEVTHSRGVLHVRQERFEESHTVAVQSKSTGKQFMGVITSISPKELYVATSSSSAPQKVYISHLRAGKKTIAHA